MLITLAIIGVVAALTIPAVIANYQHHQYIAGLKKAQTTLSQGFMNARANGENFTIDYNGDGNFDVFDESLFLQKVGFQDIAKYFKTQNVTIPAYNRITCKNSGTNCETPPPVYNIDGSLYNNYSFYSTSAPSLSLADGSYIYLHTMASAIHVGITPSKDYYWYAIVDVNGPFKKPNRAGFDIFAFYISKTGAAIPMGVEYYRIIEEEGTEDEWVDEKGYCVQVAPYGLCATASALSGKNPDGTEYWKGIKYWNNI